MKYHPLILAILLLSLLCHSSTAQQDTSVSFSHTTSVHADGFAAHDSLTHLSFPLKDLHQYLPHNHLGNPGLAFNDLSYNSHIAAADFTLRKNYYSPFFISPENLSFYNTHSPFTDLLYVTGSQREQFFRMVFSYNFSKNWNVTANFLRIRSEGFYQRQRTNDNFAALSTNFISQSHRYGLLAGIIFNSAQNEENGGIVSDTMLNSSGGATQAVPSVNLSTARSTFHNTNFFLSQFFFLGEKSTDTTNKAVVRPSSYFRISSSLQKDLFRYQDDQPASGFYDNIFFDSLKTDDLQHSVKLENFLSWSRLDNKKHRGIDDMLGFQAEAGHQLVQVIQKNSDTVFSNLIAGASIFNTYSDHGFSWKASGRYVIAGYDKSNYSASAIATKYFNDSLLSVSVNCSAKAYSADYSFQTWSGNNFQWRNNFVLMKETTIAGSISLPKYNFSLMGGVSQYSDILYYDNFAKPRQYNGSVAISFLSLKKDITLFNWHLDSDVRWQLVPDSTVIRLPEFVLQHSLYYENYAFRGHPMRLQIGVSLFYTSAYFADAWMPATNQFYLQNEKKYGNYPYLDFFINMKVRAVRIFLKSDHVNYGLSGNNYLQTPHYPLNARAYKLGVAWRFFD